MQSRGQFACGNSNCTHAVDQEGNYCAQCERKIATVEDALDYVPKFEYEIVPGIWELYSG